MDDLENQTDLRRALDEAGAEVNRLHAALEEIACRHVTIAPLWWQQKARDALTQHAK